MARINLHPNTVAFLLIEFDDILQNCNLEDDAFEDIANLLSLLADIDISSIEIALPDREEMPELEPA
jgi:hypothetical protein